MADRRAKRAAKRVAPFPSAADLRTWAAELDAVAATLAARFERAEPRRRVLAYLTGLLSNTERKNGWQLAELAELAGEASPDGMQRLLSTAHWDAEAVRGDLVAYALGHLADPAAVLVLDETGFVKKGTKSVGVAPQYCGAVGKIANCQIGVFLAYATRHGPVLLDRELYLPREWADDETRRREAGVPAAARCIPKPTLGKQLLERAFAAGVPAAWVTADSIYGGDYKLRHSLEEREQPSVLAVPSTQRVGLSAKAEQVAAAWPAAAWPAEAWRRLSAGEGSQGPRWYDWAWMPMPWRLAPEGMAHWLLARRSVSHPDELAYYFVFGPADATLPQVVQVAGTRWPAPAGRHPLAGRAGLRAGQGGGGPRRVRGAHLGRLVSPRHPGDARPRLSHGGPPARPARTRGERGADPQAGAAPDAAMTLAELLPLTVPEVRRLLFALVWQPLPAAEHVLHWSAWRRRHQARAKQAHIKRRQLSAQVRL